MPAFELKSPDLTSQFTDLMDGQANTALAAAEAWLMISQRQWELPPGADWPGDVLEHEDTVTGFPRDEATELYRQCITDNVPGTTGEAAARKLEHDRIAAAERAFRVRHCTPVRVAAHTAAKLRGQSEENGLLRSAIPGYVANLIARGTGANSA